VAGGIEESDGAGRGGVGRGGRKQRREGDGEGADVLGDTARFACGDGRVTEGVEEGRFAMIDVALKVSHVIGLAADRESEP
jgi:hypothetical protein